MESANNGRSAGGRFGQGNTFGRGRPKRAAYIDALHDGVSPGDWGEVVNRALQDAKAGDAKARDWLGKYLIGELSEDPEDRYTDGLRIVIEEVKTGYDGTEREESVRE
jgi:hypothetical protein